MPEEQSPEEVVMVRPKNFGFDRENAKNNAFQNEPGSEETIDDIRAKVTAEFDGVVKLLRDNGIDVSVFDENTEDTPDAIFPNNWFSTHEDGTIFLYPMFSEKRRRERRDDIVQYLKMNRKVSRIVNLAPYEKEGVFLEGTGSIVFDHPNQKAYACVSERTNPELLDEVCQQLGYDPIVFEARDGAGTPIYHTNVMMWIGTSLAAVVFDSVQSPQDRQRIEEELKEGRTILKLSLEEMMEFCGNCFEVKKNFLLMSERAYSNMAPENRAIIEKKVKILKSDIGTIERVGGGGIRCMVAGIHLLPK